MFKGLASDAWNFDSTHWLSAHRWFGETPDSLPIINVCGLGDFVLDRHATQRIIAADRGCGKTASLFGKAVKMYSEPVDAGFVRCKCPIPGQQLVIRKALRANLFVPPAFTNADVWSRAWQLVMAAFVFRISRTEAGQDTLWPRANDGSKENDHDKIIASTLKAMKDSHGGPSTFFTALERVLSFSPDVYLPALNTLNTAITSPRGIGHSPWIPPNTTYAFFIDEVDEIVRVAIAEPNIQQQDVSSSEPDIAKFNQPWIAAQKGLILAAAALADGELPYQLFATVRLEAWTTLASELEASIGVPAASKLGARVLQVTYDSDTLGRIFTTNAEWTHLSKCARPAATDPIECFLGWTSIATPLPSYQGNLLGVITTLTFGTPRNLLIIGRHIANKPLKERKSPKDLIRVLAESASEVARQYVHDETNFLDPNLSTLIETDLPPFFGADLARAIQKSDYTGADKINELFLRGLIGVTQAKLKASNGEFTFHRPGYWGWWDGAANIDYDLATGFALHPALIAKRMHAARNASVSSTKTTTKMTLSGLAFFHGPPEHVLLGTAQVLLRKAILPVGIISVKVDVDAHRCVVELNGKQLIPDKVALNGDSPELSVGFMVGFLCCVWKKRIEAQGGRLGRIDLQQIIDVLETLRSESLMISTGRGKDKSWFDRLGRTWLTVGEDTAQSKPRRPQWVLTVATTCINVSKQTGAPLGFKENKRIGSDTEARDIFFVMDNLSKYYIELDDTLTATFEPPSD